MVVVFNAQESYWFDLVEGAYVARFGAKVKLEHVSNRYRLHRTDGTIWEFFDYQPDNGFPAGALRSVLTAGGNSVQLDYQGSFGPVTRAVRSGVDPDGHSVQETIEYGYVGSGDNAGRLQSLVLRRQVDSGPVESLRRVEYGYYDEEDMWDTHVTRWTRAKGRVGYWHVYQGRFKSFPVKTKEYFLPGLIPAYSITPSLDRSAQTSSSSLRANTCR
ncbi:MAG: hypothetical protein GXY83_40895 [Rhodopirellula sp.]|nr:hypothetical protein [Rhodopirellula sp.]